MCSSSPARLMTAPTTWMKAPDDERAAAETNRIFKDCLANKP